MTDENKHSTDAPTELVFEQRAMPSEFVGLGVVNALLGLITLTLYRFWGKTEVRRRIWRTSFMNNEPFEYTGTGGELFKGFLIATVVFTIPYLLFLFGVQLMPPLFAIPALLVFLIFIFLVVGAAIWLAFRYLASRTVWRGIRFNIQGSAKEFSIMYFVQSILHTITLGWWDPKMQINVAEALWSGMRYGDLPFSFDKSRARDAKLYPLFAIGWVSIIVCYIVLIALFAGQIGGLTNFDPKDTDTIFGFMVKLYAAMFAFMFVVMFAFMPYQAAIMRAVASCISLDGANFRLEITWPKLAILWVTNVLIIVFSLGLLVAVAQARSAKFLLNNLKSEGHVDLSKALQTEGGPSQAEGLSDALDMGII